MGCLGPCSCCLPYEETSGTALIAAGLIHGVNHGYLDQKYLDAGIKAYEAAVSKKLNIKMVS